MPNFLTKSGYIAFDVLEELQVSILRFNKHDLEKLCFWPAELVCSGYARQLLDALLSLYATRYVSRNGALVELLATQATVVHNEKYKVSSDRLRVAINDIVLTLAQQQPLPAAHNMATPLGDHHQTLINSLGPADGVEATIVSIVGENAVDYSGFHLLCHLWIRIAHGDSRAATLLLDQLLQRNRSFEFGDWDGISGIPKCMRKDVVWMIWKMLLALSRSIGERHGAYTQASLDVFKANYSRKSRQDRINLVYACAIICAKRKNIQGGDLNIAFLKDAAKNLHVIYEQICPSKQKRGARSCKAASAAASPPTGEKNDKLKYLFCYSYKSDTAQLQPQAAKPMQYKLVNVSGLSEPASEHTIEVLKIH
jgi:hypothetical protein